MKIDQDLKKILKEYWGYENFKDQQSPVVESIASGVDTLVVMATGGGKSICFQVPGIYFGGVTLVVSPLISLMNDQVQGLQSKGINSFALHSGLSISDQNYIFDKCRNLDYAILYVSPEKVNSEWFQNRYKLLDISLVAIDEAHCVSQWGYDFRPEYLKIREQLSEISVPYIALTASATPAVQQDILKRLLSPQAKVFESGIYRENLSYKVVISDQKMEVLLRILNHLEGSTIIYARTRKICTELMEVLEAKSIKAKIYHAGLSKDIRIKAQEDWIQNRTQVIIATNAFGMGIDKPDVRQVIHFGMPPTLESYYQEAGRAGRDGEESSAILLYSGKDYQWLLKMIDHVYQDEEVIKKVFEAFCMEYQLAEGVMPTKNYYLETEKIQAKTSLSEAQIHYSLKLLEISEIISYNPDQFTPSKIMLLTNPSYLFEFYESNPSLEGIIKSLIRLYGSDLYEEFININELQLAKYSQLEISVLREKLRFLAGNKVIIYQEGKDKPTIKLLIPRPHFSKIPINKQMINFLKERAIEQLESIEAYVHSNLCKQKFLDSYFGGNLELDCGKCSSCSSKKPSDNELVYQLISKEKGGVDLLRLKQLTPEIPQESLAEILSYLLMDQKILRDLKGNFYSK